MDLTIGTIIGDFILIAGSFLLLIFLVKKFAWGNITSILDARAEKITNDIDYHWLSFLFSVTLLIYQFYIIHP